MEKDFKISRVKVVMYWTLQGMAGLLVLLLPFFVLLTMARETLPWHFTLFFVLSLLVVFCTPCCTLFMACALRYRIDAKALRIDKGIFFKSRKSLPLDKITDLELVQGPLLRALNMWTIKVQTASTASQFPAATMIGAINPEQVRNEILAARDEHAKLR